MDVDFTAACMGQSHGVSFIPKHCMLDVWLPTCCARKVGAFRHFMSHAGKVVHRPAQYLRRVVIAGVRRNIPSPIGIKMIVAQSR